MSQPGDLAEVIVKYVYEGQHMENVFGFQALTTSATFAGLASAFATAFIKNTSGGLLYSTHPDFSSTELSVRDVYPGTGAGYDYSYTQVVGNNTSGDPLPPQCASVITWRTALAGRAYRGRSYLTGYPEGNQAAGQWTIAHQGVIAAFVTAMLDLYGPSGSDPNWDFVVISRYLNKVKRAQPHGQAITAGIVRPVVYTQRRRTIGVGA